VALREIFFILNKMLRKNQLEEQQRLKSTEQTINK